MRRTTRYEEVFDTKAMERLPVTVIGVGALPAHLHHALIDDDRRSER